MLYKQPSVTGGQAAHEGPDHPAHVLIGIQLTFSGPVPAP